MTISRKLLAFAAPIALLAASGCARDFNANVARFQRLPVPQGQTFRIEPLNPANHGGLEFGQYASQVTQRLAQQGYRPAQGGPTNMIVQLDYGVGPGQQKVTTTPGFGYGGYGPGFGYGGFGPYGYGGFGGGFGYHGFGYGGFGWDYGWGGFGGPDVESYTVFPAYLTMTITRSDGEKLFEGRARAQSTTDNLTYLVPNLIDAMFTGFPGNNGQDIRITVTQQQQKARNAPPQGYAPQGPRS
ncbi:DUF4136 domain-containing protein [Sphingomonas sp.]|uniref:DUF4136 domain-containing protein n=1 Tax=Sphingomonas sp. TaxID=28214 RepID=UPI003B00BDAA